MLRSSCPQRLSPLLRERFSAEARRLQRAEAALGQTLFGPQRDDIAIYYRGRESRSYASQGEQRLSAFLLVAALTLAIQRYHGHRPVVLLDDVVSELDERNRKMILIFFGAHSFKSLLRMWKSASCIAILMPLRLFRSARSTGRRNYARLQLRSASCVTSANTVNERLYEHL